MLYLLVVSPHPDDAELGMGGTLARAHAEGRSTGIVDLTRGEAATKGTPEERAAEADAASKVLGLDVRRNLGWPDSRILDSEDRRLQLARVLRDRTVHPVQKGRDGQHLIAVLHKIAVNEFFLP